MTITIMLFAMLALVLINVPIAIALALVAVGAVWITQGAYMLPNVALVMFSGACTSSIRPARTSAIATA